MVRAKNPPEVKKHHLPALFLAVLLPVSALAQDQSPPPLPVETVHSSDLRLDIETVIANGNWYLMGEYPKGYRIGNARTAGMTSSAALYVEACDSRALNGYGAIEHMLVAGKYAGKRVRIGAHVKYEGDALANFYANALAQDNRILRAARWRSARAQRGDWQAGEMVMDIPGAAATIELGVYIQSSAHSRAWLENVFIEIVDESVPLAGERAAANIFQRNPEDTPVNCDGKRQ